MGKTGNLIEELKKENQLLALQSDYENGRIKEEELSEEQKQELLSLYEKQISSLEESIANHKRVLADYKVKIAQKMKETFKK